MRLLRALTSAKPTACIRACMVSRRPAGLSLPTHTAAAVSMTPVRTYAKKANKKDMAKPHAEETTFEFDEKELEDRFAHTMSALKEEFGAMRIGRANPAILDKVRVKLESTQLPLRDVAQVTIRDPQTLLVTVHDTEYIKAVEKGIRDANLNLNPVVDSKLIRVPVPKPSKDARDKLVKLASQAGEQTKSKVRAIRQDGMKHLKQASKGQSADQIRKLEKLVQTITDKYNKHVDELLKTKVKEIQA